MLIWTWAIVAALAAVTITLHYEVLRFTSDWLLPHMEAPKRLHIVASVFAVFCGHVVEILIFAGAMAAMELGLGMGTIEGSFRASFSDFVYFSATSYTTLGYGDLYPTGSLRLVAAIEALTGLLMITWSASFTYLQMENFWRVNRQRRPRHD